MSLGTAEAAEVFRTRFHGTKRACKIGGGGDRNIEPCKLADCNLCKILKKGFDIKLAKVTGMFGPGIYSSC